MVPFIWNSQNRQSIETKSTSVVPGTEGGRTWGMTASSYKVLEGGDENVLK